jgi:hypothetical protein
MGSFPSKVPEDLVVLAASVLKCVGKDGQAGGVEVAGGQEAVVVGGLGQADHSA